MGTVLPSEWAREAPLSTMRHRGYYSFKDYAEWHKLSAEEKLNFVSSLDHEKSILKIINAFALKLINIPTPDELAWYMAREVVGILGFVDCVIYFLDETRNRLIQKAAIWAVKNPENDKIVNVLEIPVGHGITGHVAASRNPIIVDDLAEDRRYIPDIEAARSEICVPIMVDDTLVGVIDCEDPRISHFNEENLEILTTIAAMAGARLKAIDQNRVEKLNRDLSREMERRTRVESKLRRSEERFRDFSEVGSDWHWEFDRDLRYVMLVPSGQHSRLVPVEDFIGRDRASVKPEGLSEKRWQAHLDQLAAREPFRNFLQPRLLNDGTTIWLSISGKPIFDKQGEFDGYRGTATDVTEMVAMREKLKPHG